MSVAVAVANSAKALHMCMDNTTGQLFLLWTEEFRLKTGPQRAQRHT